MIHASLIYCQLNKKSWSFKGPHWEGLGAGEEGDDRGWVGWMASLTRWTRVWVNSRSCWWTGRPGVLRFMGSQRVGHNWETELNWNELKHSAGVQPWWIQGNSKGRRNWRPRKDLFNYRYKERLEKNSVVRKSVEKRGWITWFTWDTNKALRQEVCTTYVGHRSLSILPKERRHWGLLVRA